MALQLPLLCLGTTAEPVSFSSALTSSISLGGCVHLRSIIVGACSAALAARAGHSQPVPADMLHLLSLSVAPIFGIETSSSSLSAPRRNSTLYEEVLQLGQQLAHREGSVRF